MCAVVVIYFVTKLTFVWWKGVLAILFIMSISYIVRNLPFPIGFSISIGYVITALTDLVTNVLYVIHAKGKHLQWVIAAFSIFGVAVLFRTLDKIIITGSSIWRYIGCGTYLVD